MFVHTVIMVIEPHMKQGRQHKLISTIFLATSVTKKLDHNSRNGCYETPWHVTGVSKLSGPEGTPKGMYVQIGLSEQGKAGSLLDNPAKNNKRMNSC